jgi:HEAT repeat protein
MADRHRISLITCLALLGAFSCGCQQDVGQEATLLKQLANSDADQRWSAALAIRDSAPVASIFVPPLVKALDDQDARVRFAAAQAIGEAGANAREHIPALVKLANEHPDVQVRAALSDAVVKISSPE